MSPTSFTRVAVALGVLGALVATAGVAGIIWAASGNNAGSDSGAAAVATPTPSPVSTATPAPDDLQRRLDLIQAHLDELQQRVESLESSTSAASGRIVGRTTGKDAAPFPGAVISLDGTGRAVESAADGTFELDDVPLGFWTLVVSYRVESGSTYDCYEVVPNVRLIDDHERTDVGDIALRGTFIAYPESCRQLPP